MEAQLVMGEVAAIGKPQAKPFKDRRSSAARDLRRAQEQNKHQLLRDMLQRALRAGFTAGYLLAEAWFGCKETFSAVWSTDSSASFK